MSVIAHCASLRESGNQDISSSPLIRKTSEDKSSIRTELSIVLSLLSPTEITIAHTLGIFPEYDCIEKISE